MFLGDSPAYLAYLDDRDRFGTDELLIVGLPLPDPLTQAARETLERLRERLLAHDDVDEVATVLAGERLERTDGGMQVRSWADLADEAPDRTAALLDELADDPLYGATFVPRDRTHTVVVVGIVSKRDRPAEEGPRIVADIDSVLADQGFTTDVHRSGWLATITGILTESVFSLMVLFPVSAVLLLGLVWLLFRRLWPAALSMAVALLAVLWTMGFAVQLDREINILMTAVPAIVLVVAFSDTVHLCSAYLLELAEGRAKREAILNAAEDVGTACLWTSVTTFVGFVSLSLIPTPLFRHMGFVLGFSVAVALLLAMTVAPVLFATLDTPAPLRAGSTSAAQAALDRGLAWAAGVSTGRPGTVTAIFGVILVLCSAYAATIAIETDFEGRLAEDHPLRQDDAWFHDQLSGTTRVDLMIDAGAEGGLLAPEVVAGLRALQDRLEADPRVTHAMSYVDLLDRIHAVLAPDSPPPTTRAGIAQEMLAFEIGGGTALDGLVDVERRRARASLQLGDRGVRNAADVGHEAVRLAHEQLGAFATVEPTGLTWLLGDWLDEIVEGQRNSVLLSVLLVAILMSVALRSVRVGVVSMIPNLLPVLAIGGWIGFAWDAMDSDTLIVAIMAIGIGVDDTIHFLVRYKREASRCATTQEAIERTFHFAGRAIAMTTVILVAGFLPFAASDYFTVDMIGKLLPTALVAALLADVLLVPALVQLGPLAMTPRG